MPFDSLSVANYFIEKAIAESRPISPMKLQKLIYFAHGWHLALRDSPLIDEQVEAWKFGPVIPSVYTEFRPYGNSDITEPGRAWETIPGDDPFRMRVVTPRIDDDAEKADEVRPLLDRIWEVYGGCSAIQLSNATHLPDTPWDRVRQRYDGIFPKGTDIPTDYIEEYFRNILRTNSSASACSSPA